MPLPKGYGSRVVFADPDVVYNALDAAASSNRKVVGYGLLGLSEEMLPASTTIMGVALQSIMVLTLRVIEQCRRP